jgi:hypothetical protein
MLLGFSRAAPDLPRGGSTRQSAKIWPGRKEKTKVRLDSTFLG